MPSRTQREWQGLDIAYCRAIADALLGSPTKVKFIGTTSKVRFSVLQSGEIDVLIRDSEHTFIRNTQLGLDEPAVNFFTAQTFMVRKSLGVAHTKDLNGATICLLTGTTLETNIADYNRANNIKINTLLFDKPEEAFAAADAGRCDGYTDDGGSVAAARSTMKTAERLDVPARDDRRIAAARPVHPPGRRGLDAAGEVGALRHDGRRGARRHQGQCRSDEVQSPRTRKCGASSAWKAISASCSASTTTGPIASSRTSATTARSTKLTFGDKGLGLPRGMNNLLPQRRADDHADLALTCSYRRPWSGDRHPRARGAMAAARGRGGGRLVSRLRQPPAISARRHTTFGFGFLADHANFDIPFRLIPWTVGDTYAPRAAGLRAQHAAGLGHEHRRGDAARAAGRHHAAVDQLAGAQHRARLHRVGAQHAAARADHLLVCRGAADAAVAAPEHRRCRLSLLNIRGLYLPA